MMEEIIKKYAASWGGKPLSSWLSIPGHGIDRKYYPNVTEGNIHNSFQLWKETYYAYLPDEQQPELLIETAIFTVTWTWMMAGNDIVPYTTETVIGGEV